MTTPIRITYRENVEYFIQAQSQSPPTLGKSIPEKTQRIIMGVVFVGAFVFAFGQQLLRGTSPKIVMLGVVFVTLILCFWFWFFKKIGLYKPGTPFEHRWTEKDRLRYQKNYRKRTGHDEMTIVCDFNEDGFVLNPENAKATNYAWTSIVLVAERPKGLFVYFRSWMYFWFPKASFASQKDYLALIEIIARRVARFERPDFPNMAFIALGSNLGNSAETFNQVLSRLQEFSDARLLKSSVIETAPVDCPPGSPIFLNAVAAILPRASETPESLLAKLQALEKEFGRQPKQVLNEARPLDLDLIAFGQETRATPALTLPHPRAHLREFVLRPLAEIAPDFILPGQTGSVAQLLAALPAK